MVTVSFRAEHRLGPHTQVGGQEKAADLEIILSHFVLWQNNILEKKNEREAKHDTHIYAIE